MRHGCECGCDTEAEANAVAAIITSSPTRCLPNTSSSLPPSLLLHPLSPLLAIPCYTLPLTVAAPTVAARLTANKTTVNGVWHHLPMQATLHCPYCPPLCHAHTVQYVWPVRELAFKIFDSNEEDKSKV